MSIFDQEVAVGDLVAGTSSTNESICGVLLKLEDDKAIINACKQGNKTIHSKDGWAMYVLAEGFDDADEVAEKLKLDETSSDSTIDDIAESIASGVEETILGGDAIGEAIRLEFNALDENQIIHLHEVFGNDKNIEEFMNDWKNCDKFYEWLQGVAYSKIRSG